MDPVLFFNVSSCQIRIYVSDRERMYKRITTMAAIVNLDSK